MSTTKKMLIVVGRLPLLFLIDSILKGSFLNYGEVPAGPVSQTLHPENYDIIRTFIWLLIQSTVIMASLIAVCSPIEFLLELYGSILGVLLLLFSYHCNDQLVHGEQHKFVDEQKSDKDGSGENKLQIALEHRSQVSGVIVNMLTQFFIVLAFDQICVVGTLHRKKSLTKYARYPVDIILFLSVTLPIHLRAVFDIDSILYELSPNLAIIFPLLLLLIHVCIVIFSHTMFLVPALGNARNNAREIGFDGLLMGLVERANLSWLMRMFFLTKVIYQVWSSKVLSDAREFSDMSCYEILSTVQLLVREVLETMCGTILSVMSMASIVSIISGCCLNIVYRVIGAQDDEESLQPAVSGFLFVLLAMQTGITSIKSDDRLKLLFQNCVLLVVANQHFVQTVAADLVLKASTDDTAIVKHVRPMLPYFIFFSFPFLVVARLWECTFRLSWLLAISAFSLELIIKSVGTLTYYTLNMLQSRTNLLQENIEDWFFIIKAVCGCLEFACGIFLFFNGAYIFFFEQGGLIRLVMMIIHFYCNIYQTAVKGIATYRLRQSAWEKMNRLQIASQEQLDENDDICPICYQEMTEAVVIKCSHVFHRGCLQKWFSIQEKCPLCHVDLSEESPPNAKK